MSPATPPNPDHPPGASLQFQTAEPLAAAPASALRCAVCSSPIQGTYFHAQGAVVCALCAQRIESGQQQPPPLSLARAALYGGAAALAGSTLYALVSILTGLEIGLIAIVVGVMVGKAIRHASRGMGGRPQQILAVVLTYFAITTSYIPVFIHQQIKNPPKQSQTASAPPRTADEPQPRMGVGAAMAILVLIAAAAPFLSLSEGASGIITLFIIFIGLQRAWRLTGRSEVLVMGPYEAAPSE